MDKKDIEYVISKHGVSRHTKKKRYAIVALSAATFIVAVSAVYLSARPQVYNEVFPEVDFRSAVVDDYIGSCKCPDERDNSGKLCGDRSAWSKGRNVICYGKDGSILKKDTYKP